MVTESRKNPEEYGKHYHKRSNVESTNSAKKRKFNNFVRSKIDENKENEELMNWDFYNFSFLTRGYHEYGVTPKFVNKKG